MLLQVLVVGAGVAGLAAIAQAKAMGAVVRAYDVRPVVREQIESLGAEFLQVRFSMKSTTATSSFSSSFNDIEPLAMLYRAPVSVSAVSVGGVGVDDGDFGG